MSIQDVLEEFEKVLMNTYKSDGCMTSAITEIYKNQAHSQIIGLMLGEQEIADIIRDNLQFKDLSVNNGRILIAHSIHQAQKEKLGEKINPSHSQKEQNFTEDDFLKETPREELKENIGNIIRNYGASRIMTRTARLLIAEKIVEFLEDKR